MKTSKKEYIGFAQLYNLEHHIRESWTTTKIIRMLSIALDNLISYDMLSSGLDASSSKWFKVRAIFKILLNAK